LLCNLIPDGIQECRQGLTPTEVTDYSLWKAILKMKRPQHHLPPIRINHNTWARTEKQKATAFAEYLASVFQLFPSQLPVMEEETINNYLKCPTSNSLLMKKIQINEVKNVMQYKINPKKDLVCDLIKGKIPKELSQKGSQSNNTNLKLHTTNRISLLSMESGTNHNDCKTRKEPE